MYPHRGICTYVYMYICTCGIFDMFWNLIDFYGILRPFLLWCFVGIILRGGGRSPYQFRRRNPTKRSIRTLLALYSSAKGLRGALVDPHLRPSFLSFGRDLSDIGRFSNIIPGLFFHPH